jgi:hypothetical protein
METDARLEKDFRSADRRKKQNRQCKKAGDSA